LDRAHRIGVRTHSGARRRISGEESRWEAGVDRTKRNERIGLGAMVCIAAAAVIAAVYGHVGMAVILFLVAGTPLPMLARTRARRSRVAETVHDDT
jgi:Flp pilus assembly protein TadB